MDKRVVLVAIITALLVGCVSNKKNDFPRDVYTTRTPTADQITKAREIISGQIKNADSAKFRNETVHEIASMKANSTSSKRTLYCGQVNAKNIIGTYSGYTWASTFLEEPFYPQIKRETEYLCTTYVYEN